MLYVALIMLFLHSSVALHAAASIPLATDQRVIDFFKAARTGDVKTLEAVIAANPYMVNATDTQGHNALFAAVDSNQYAAASKLHNRGAQLSEQDIAVLQQGTGAAILAKLGLIKKPFNPARFQEQLETTAKPLTVGHQKGTNKGGLISAYTFNPEDPWIANLMMHEEFSYAPEHEIGKSISGVSMNASGDRVLCRLGKENKDTFEMFERQKNGIWNKITLLPVMLGNTFATNDAMDQIVVPGADRLWVFNYDAGTNAWTRQGIAPIDNSWLRASASMNSAGTLIALSTGKIDLFYKNKNAWQQVPTSLVDRDVMSVAMSYYGRYIIAGSHHELKIFECPYQGVPTCKQVQKLPVFKEIDTVAISSNGNYIGIKACGGPDYGHGVYSSRCQCLVYKRQDSSGDKTMWEEADVIDLHIGADQIPSFMAINNDGNRIAMATKEAYFYFKQGNSWRSIFIPMIPMISYYEPRPAELAMNSAGDRIAVTAQYCPMRILSFHPEVSELNAQQMNFVRDLYEQNGKIKGSKNPHAWIILSPEDVKLFKTLPKSIQTRLRQIYKLTTQESLEAMRKKLAEKRAQET